MRVKVYLIDQNSGVETFERECSAEDLIAGEDPELTLAMDELRKSGRYWLGGGAAPLFYLSRVD